MNNYEDMDKARLLESIKSKKNTNRTKFSIFMGYAAVISLIVGLLILVITMFANSRRTKQQVQANVDAVLNSPKIQEYRVKEARRQRELEKKRRLKELGIEGISKPVQKNDLLNQQLRKQELAKQQELRAGAQGVDYTSELAAYNARLREVQAKEARLRAEAAAAEKEKARAQAEQLRLAQERERQSLNNEYAQQQAQRDAENKARLAQERAEKERAAKMKAAQEAAAKAAKLKAQVEALKTQRNTLRK